MFLIWKECRLLKYENPSLSRPNLKVTKKIEYVNDLKEAVWGYILMLETKAQIEIKDNSFLVYIEAKWSKIFNRKDIFENIFVKVP